MWSYNGDFFDAAFYNDDVHIESNYGPKQLSGEAFIVHNHSVPSVHAHHYSLYTKKATCNCFAKATNVIVETFHTNEPPSADALHTYFDHTVTVRDDMLALPLHCDKCVDAWTPMRYYAQTHYTNHSPVAFAKIGFSPTLLANATTIFVKQAQESHTAKIFVRKSSCQCIEEAGKVEVKRFTDISERELVQHLFNVTVSDEDINEQSTRCQTCLPAPSNWTPSKVRIGHFEKYTSHGIMYSTFLSETLVPHVAYEIESQVFMIAEKKQGCDCFEDVGQIEVTKPLTLEQFIDFLYEEFSMTVQPATASLQTECDTCAQQMFMLP